MAWGIGLAAAGAVIAYASAGGPGALAGAVIGAVTGVLAPSAYEGIREMRVRRETWLATGEKTPPQSWARLLDPRREVVGFIGREDELAALVSWCQDVHSGRLRLVTGPGGVGKTRLAVELADRMTKHGWKCERIADGKESEAITALLAVTRNRALLVVDYAETRGGLGQMLSALAGDQGEGVRVLLLARSVGDWWDQLGVGEPAVWDLVQVARSESLELSAEVAPQLSDADVIAMAVRSFARKLGMPEKAVEVDSGSGAGRRRMLDLHAAALIAVLGRASARPVRVDIGAVLGELLRHEQHFWYQSARAYGLRDGRDGTPPRVLRQIVAAGCLLGAASEAEARALAGRVPGMSPSAKIAGWLRVLYPPDPGGADWIGAVQPDRLAELHTLRELADSADLAQACLCDLDARQALRAVTLLARASVDNPEAGTLLSQTLPDVADVIATMQAPVETLTTIVNAIPYPTVLLTPAAVALGRRVMSALPVDTEQAVRAYWLTNLGVRLSDLGRPFEALPVTEEAVALYRQLAASGPERYRPDLAAALTSLGLRLSDVGRPIEALAVTEESVAIRRELAAANADRYRPGLARSLDSLGVRLSELKRSASALTVEHEAVAIYRELAAASPHRYRPDLASALIDLGVALSALGRLAEALTVTEEAVSMYRELAAAWPDRYWPDLARSLSRLGVRLSDLGHSRAALPAAEEAMAMYRDLAAVSPDRYRPELARSLTNAGVTYSALGRLAEALPVTEEAVAIRRELAAASPERYRVNLAKSLNNLGVKLSALGRTAEALAVAEEAVAVYRELSVDGLDRYRADLAGSLTNLGVSLSTLRRPKEALAATEEAVAAYRELAVEVPDRYRADLAKSLTNLGITLSTLGRPTEALSATEDALAIYRELVVDNPDRYRRDLGRLLHFSELLEVPDRNAGTDASPDGNGQFTELPDP